MCPEEQKQRGIALIEEGFVALESLLLNTVMVPIALEVNQRWPIAA